MRLIPSVLVLGAFLLSSPVVAQDGAQDRGQRDFCADRPGQGTPVCVLDQGRWQVELGLFDTSRQSDDSAKTRSWDTGDLLVRYGLTGLTELQMGLTSWNHQTVSDRASGAREVSKGVGDLTLALRHSLANPDGSGVSVAVQGFVTAPTGARDIRADGFEGGVILPVSLPLDADWSLSLSPQVGWVSDADGEGRHAAYTMVAGLGRDIGQWNLGAELWISRDDDPAQPTTQSTFDLTAAWSPPALPDAQLDFGVDLGLNDDSPDVAFGVGVARRF